MFSFLQQRLGKSPTKPQKNMTRHDSIESAFARVNARNASKDISETPSLTTATSLTDTSSEPTDSSEKQENHVQIPEASEAVGKHHRILSTGEDTHTLLAESLLERAEDDTRERLLQQGVQALHEDWDIGAMPGGNLGLPIDNDGGAKKRRSTRIDILSQASKVMETTTSILGKRGREVMEAGLEKIQDLKSVKRRPATRPTNSDSPPLDGPKKRARFSASYQEKSSSPQFKTRTKAAKKGSRHWINQGLYVGQSPGFNPKLTESKNKLKKASNKDINTKKSAIMPLPMFAGERTLAQGRDFKLPFDVFSPLPPGQPKPDEWKKTHKNVFVGDASDLWKKAKPMEHSLCICKPEEGCDEHCFNRFMLYECEDSNCNVDAEHCTNRAFADLRARCKKGGKYNIGVEVMKTIDRGYGVRANRTFEPNQIIIEYTGEIITQEECDHRMNTRYKDAECYYLMDFDQSMVLDATRGSIARFINHSCAPNCRMIKWTVSGKPRMALFAGDEGIMTGEELTYDYNFDPFSAKNVQECRCGAEKCRGVLGPKPKDVKEALKPITTSKKRNVQQVVEDAVETVTKRRKIALSSSVKSAFTTAKTQTSRRLSQASMLGSSSTPAGPPAVKTSKRAPRGLQRKSTTILLKDEKTEQPEKADSRRKSTGDIINKRGWKGWALVPETPPESPTDVGPPPEEGGSKWQSVDSNPTGVEANAVGTVRRSNRGTPGKSIRVIALGEDEIKEWR